MNMDERVAYEVYDECPDCDELHLMAGGSATRAEIAAQQSFLPADTAVQFIIHTLH